MTIPAIGQISVIDINTELAKSPTAQLSLNNTDVRTLFAKSSGQISFSDGRGKSNAPSNFDVVISSHTLNFNVYNEAIARGWNGTSPFNMNITINSGVYLGSSSVDVYAFDTGTLPAGCNIILTNNGYITGRGGDGGGAGRSYVGDHGGHALIARVPITIYNYGYIQAGGGGGGSRPDLGWGGGGGGAGYPGGNGGIGGGYDDGMGPNGRTGSITSGGIGGYYYGGAGGGPAQSGSASATVGSQPGGGPGNAVVGNANIAWGQVGSITGSIS